MRLALGRLKRWATGKGWEPIFLGDKEKKMVLGLKNEEKNEEEKEKMKAAKDDKDMESDNVV